MDKLVEFLKNIINNINISLEKMNDAINNFGKSSDQIAAKKEVKLLEMINKKPIMKTNYKKIEESFKGLQDSASKEINQVFGK